MIFAWCVNKILKIIQILFQFARPEASQAHLKYKWKSLLLSEHSESNVSKGDELQICAHMVRPFNSHSSLRSKLLYGKTIEPLGPSSVEDSPRAVFHNNNFERDLIKVCKIDFNFKIVI